MTVINYLSNLAIPITILLILVYGLIERNKVFDTFLDGAKEGDKILTYYIYSPFSNEQDDVLTRLDFIIDDNAI